MTLSRREFAALFGVGPQRPAPDPELPTFRAEVRVVEIHVAVFDRRQRPIRGLMKSDFELIDHNRRREIEIFESEESPITLGLLLDVSGSMLEAIPALKRAVAELIEQLRLDDQAAIFAFNERLMLVADFSTDRSGITEALRRLRPAGRTALFDAVALAMQRLAARSGKKALVMFTDGKDNSSALSLQSAVRRARIESIQTHTVAQGEALQSRALVATLEEIARLTGGLSFRVRKAQEMREVFAEISKDLSASYLLGFTAHPGKGEWRPLKVIVRNHPGARVRCREGYLAL